MMPPACEELAVWLEMKHQCPQRSKAVGALAVAFSVGGGGVRGGAGVLCFQQNMQPLHFLALAAAQMPRMLFLILFSFSFTCQHAWGTNQ